MAVDPEPVDLVVDDLVFDGLASGPADGEVVLLLHGFPQSSAAWRHQLKSLGGAGYRAIAPDQRGYSPRARPSTPAAYTTDHLVADVLGFADALGAAQFHLVGHDWGGAVAWQVAGRHGERLRTLAVLSTPHPAAFTLALRGELGGDQGDRSGYMDIFRAEGAENGMLANDAQGLRMLFLASGMSEEEAAPYLAIHSSPEALGAALNWYRAADVTLVDGLGPITVPTLYGWSTDDPVLGREAAEATGRFVEGPYRFEVFEGVSHWIPEHGADRLDRVLLEHLAST